MTDHTPSGTEREILSQPQVWQQVLDAVDPRPLSELLHRQIGGSDITDIVVTGCGSTHYLALTVATLLRDAGHRALALPASELVEQASPALVNPATTLLFALSRSGTTTETVRAVDHFRELGGAHVAAITCYPDSTLAQQADITWAAIAAQEEQVAQTRSFTSMLLIASALVGALRGDDVGVLQRLPELASTLLDDTREPMATLARDASIEAFYFLGSGPLFGIASEGMLKVKEMSLTASEAYHTLEFRHGPMSMCDPSAAVIALQSPLRQSLEQAVLDDIAPFGAHLATLAPGARIPPDLPSWASPALYVLPLQLLALERALAKGLDPDSPRHLTAVIHLDATAAS